MGSIVADGARLTLADRGTLRIAGDVNGPLEVVGERSHLQLTSATLVTDLTLDGPALHAPPGTAILRLQGRLRIGRCRDVTVTAGPTGYQFEGLLGARADPAAAASRLQGLTLRGVTVRDDATGRARLYELSAAAVIEPVVSELRVRGYGFAWRSPRADGRWRRPYRWQPATAAATSPPPRERSERRSARSASSATGNGQALRS